MVIPAEARVIFARRIAALQRWVDSRHATAEQVASALLFAWSKRTQPDMAPKRAPNNTARLVETEQVSSFVDWLCTCSTFEEAAYWVATAYATLVGDETRTQRALYFTHPVLAERVIDDLLSQGASLIEDHWHDPACGGAAFLVPVALRMRDEMRAAGYPPKKIIDKISQNLSGNDTSQTLIDFSESFLSLALSSVIREACRPLRVRITKGDGLRNWRRAKRPEVVICNPPYRKLKAAEADHYRGTLEKAIQGQPNIYALFIEQSLRIVQRGGLVGLLTPTSYLTGQLFSNLREHICRISQIHSIDLLGNRSATFLNVDQETAIATIRATPSQTPQSPTVSVWVNAGFEKIGAVHIRDDGGPWALPRSIQDKFLLSSAEKSNHRLNDYGYVPRIGSLVAYRSERVTHATAESGIGRKVAPLIWATDITPEGKFVHGRPNRQRTPEPFIEISSYEDAGVLVQPAVFLQRLTSTDQNRRLVAAAMPAKFLKKHTAYVCENHVIALLQAEGSEWSPEEMAEIIQTSLVDRLYRTISGSTNIGVYELGQLPLPCPRKLREHLVAGLNIESAIRKAYDS